MLVPPRRLLTARRLATCALEQPIAQQVAAANARGAGAYELRFSPAANGWGVFAARRFSPGELVFAATALRVARARGSHTVQTARATHVVMDLPARFGNHCCEARAPRSLRLFVRSAPPCPSLRAFPSSLPTP